MKRSESDIQSEKEVCVDIVKHFEDSPGMQLWRNNTGVMRIGRRWISFGLCKGSSDYIGYIEIIITPAMVGKKVAIFAAVEAKKTGGTSTPEQEEFVDCVASSGGLAMVADSLEVVIKRIRGYMTKLRRKIK